MNSFSDESIANAEQELLDYIRESPRMPGDLEDKFCPDTTGIRVATSPDGTRYVEIGGGPTPAVLYLQPLGRWKQSVYFYALSLLIADDLVDYRFDQEGYVWYFIKTSEVES